MESTEAEIAREVENPDRWEYRVLEMAPRNAKEETERVLNLSGNMGWELVAVSAYGASHFAWLKRYRVESIESNPYAWNGKIPPEDARE